MPIAASPASYSPGVSLARGSFASDPVIPGGSAGAGCGANGFSSLLLLSARAARLRLRSLCLARSWRRLRLHPAHTETEN